MKRIKIIPTVFVLFSLMLSNLVSAQSKKEFSVHDLVESKEYKIEVLRAYPQSGKMVNLTSTYTLTIKNDTVISHLPYYGRAYSIPYGGGDGLIFTSTIQNYKIEKKGDKEMRIKFETVTPEDRYLFYLTVFENKSASINVIMNNRTGIRYGGFVESIPED